MAYLEIETGEGESKVALSSERLSIGRLSYNDITLGSPQISRQHAELRRINGVWWIADLNSTNGLHLRGQRIQEHRLSDGDQIVLAPNISLRFVEESRDTESDDQLFSPSMRPDITAGIFSAREARTVRRPTGLRAADLAEQSKTHPVGWTFPVSGQVYPPLAAPGPMEPPKPRSIYADDEVPFVPGSMASHAPPASPLAPTDSYVPNPPAVSPATSPSPPTIPISSWNATNSSVPDPYVDKIPDNSDRYSLPRVPLQTETATYDPYRRAGPASDIGSTTGLGSGNLLHVCQTCGQLTAPDSVYCQSCHHSIAQECSNCRLSLLPIQDRCPRCHTPNDASVRRSHPGR